MQRCGALPTPLACSHLSSHSTHLLAAKPLSIGVSARRQQRCRAVRAHTIKPKDLSVLPCTPPKIACCTLGVVRESTSDELLVDPRVYSVQVLTTFSMLQ